MDDAHACRAGDRYEGYLILFVYEGSEGLELEAKTCASMRLSRTLAESERSERVYLEEASVGRDSQEM